MFILRKFVSRKVEKLNFLNRFKIFCFWYIASYKIFASFNTVCVVDVCFVIFIVYGVLSVFIRLWSRYIRLWAV